MHTLHLASIIVAQAVPGVVTASKTIVQWLKDNALYAVLPIFAIGCLMFFGVGFSERNKARGMTFAGGAVGGAVFLYVLATPIANLILTAAGQQAVF